MIWNSVGFLVIIVDDLILNNSSHILKNRSFCLYCQKENNCFCCPN